MEIRKMSQFNTSGMSKTPCPGCGQKFINGNKLNRHKRTCPELNDEDEDEGRSLSEFMGGDD